MELHLAVSKLNHNLYLHQSHNHPLDLAMKHGNAPSSLKTSCLLNASMENVPVKMYFLSILPFLTIKGFSGNATLEDKCRCDMILTWDNGVANCSEEVPQPEPAPQPTPQPSPEPSPQPGGCTSAYQCEQFADNYNFVDCVQGKCACKTALGFTGAATNDSKCTCLEPRTTVWDDCTSLPYCINPIKCAPTPPVQRECTTIKTCKKVDDCASVTTFPLAVVCGLTAPGQSACLCQNNLGFEGYGNKTNPCTCPAPKKVHWIDNIPYCLNLSACAAI